MEGEGRRGREEGKRKRKGREGKGAPHFFVQVYAPEYATDLYQKSLSFGHCINMSNKIAGHAMC